MFEKLKYLKNLRSQAKQIQNALAQEITEGQAAWGKVKIVMNGNQEIISISIDPELMKLENKDKLESSLKEATNEAIKKVQRIMAEKMHQMGGFDKFTTGGLGGFPGV